MTRKTTGATAPDADKAAEAKAAEEAAKAEAEAKAAVEAAAKAEAAAAEEAEKEAAKEAERIANGEAMTAENAALLEKVKARGQAIAAAMSTADREEIRAINQQCSHTKNALGAVLSVCARTDDWANMCKAIDGMAAEARAGVEDRALERAGITA